MLFLFFDFTPLYGHDHSDVPVTAKIRIGWDADSINAVETAHAARPPEPPRLPYTGARGNNITAEKRTGA